MPFFAELPVEPEPVPGPGPFYRDVPENQPEHWTPAPVATGVVIGRSEHTVVRLDVRDSYPRGLALELRHQGRAIGRASVPASEGVSLSLRRAGTRVLGLVEDRVVLKAPYAGGGGGRVALRAVGFRPRLSRVALWAANVRDYTFDTAPVDWWVGSGEWDVTNRWSCTPDWSWFGGYSPEVAAIWHKWPLRGDVVLDLTRRPR